MLPILSQVEFKKSKREPLLDYSLYAEEVEDLSIRVPRIGKRLSDVQWMSDKNLADVMSMTRSRAVHSVDLLTFSYSAGVEITQLREFYPEVLRHWEEYAKAAEKFDQSSEYEGTEIAHFALQGDDYEMVNRMTCFGILLGWGKLLPRLAAILDYRNPKLDGMLERLFLPFLFDRSSAPDECLRHLPYFKTLKIFKAPAADRSVLIKDYLDEWYNASRREPYYESHKRDTSFMVYWSWESGAITVILEVDDAIYRDSLFYPKDLVSFYRSCRDEEIFDKPNVDNSNEIRVRSGDICPISGIWEAINKPSYQRKFQKGEVITASESSYGLTVWIFKGQENSSI
jgi:hypothetical protein